jgi:hypothetical protein
MVEERGVEESPIRVTMKGGATPRALKEVGIIFGYQLYLFVLVHLFLLFF